MWIDPHGASKTWDLYSVLAGEEVAHTCVTMKSSSWSAWRGELCIVQRDYCDERGSSPQWVTTGRGLNQPTHPPVSTNLHFLHSTLLPTLPSTFHLTLHPSLHPSPQIPSIFTLSNLT